MGFVYRNTKLDIKSVEGIGYWMRKNKFEESCPAKETCKTFIVLITS